MTKAKTPPKLKKKGAKFYTKVLQDYELVDVHDLERLQMAGKCLDEVAEIEERVKTDGMFMVNRYGATVEHPGCKMIRDLRMLFVKIIRELGLDLEMAADSRPPRRY